MKIFCITQIAYLDFHYRKCLYTIATSPDLFMMLLKISPSPCRVGYIMCCFSTFSPLLFVMVPFQTSYLGIYGTNLHHIFRIGGDEQCDAQGTLLWQPFLTKSEKLAYLCFIRRTLAFQNGLEYRNADGRVNSSDGPSISDENLMSFHRVIPKFSKLECI